MIALAIGLTTGAMEPAPAEEWPARQADFAPGSEIARRLLDADFQSREQVILQEIKKGNMPEFWRQFVKVTTTLTRDDVTLTAEFEVSPDYLAVGSDVDYFLAPFSPASAWEVADRLECVLPTPRMVDAIYRQAAVQLVPSPRPPGPDMTTMAAFLEHDGEIDRQRSAFLPSHPLGALVAGHKKDVVLSATLAEARGKVAIYGWHRPDGTPIQPLYTGHTGAWVDYSHGVRLVRRQLLVEGKPTTIEAVLADPDLAGLLSGEGAFVFPRVTPVTAPPPAFPETTEEWRLQPGVRIWLNLPARPEKKENAAAPPLDLVLYALPNGATIEQTLGRRVTADADAAFDRQHIGAQTRWLREHFSERELVVAYLECEGRSWPAWRKQHDPQNTRVPQIVEALRRRFAGRSPRLTLTGHSGGGSFTFGFLNGVEAIPEDIVRLAFLDSNYAYDAGQDHPAKLTRWFQAAPDRHLFVLAYHDSIALYQGKPFVSEAGGTWGRSHAMQRDLAAAFPFVAETDTEWQRFSALDGRVSFLLRENPDRAILHTRLVEWNGFIHACLAGTRWAESGYRCGGPRVYDTWIEEE